MAKHARWLGVLIALLALASEAQADFGALYQGSIRFEGYGNSITDGHTLMSMSTAAATWTQNTFIANPGGLFCNNKFYTIMTFPGATPPRTHCATPPMTTGGGTYPRCFISTYYQPGPKEQYVMDCRAPSPTGVAPFRCKGGINAGARCWEQCIGGSNDGNRCTQNSDCPGGACSGPSDDFCTRACVGGSQAGNACATSSDCPGGVCSSGQPSDACNGGANDGNACTDDSQCPGGACSPGVCLGFLPLNFVGVPITGSNTASLKTMQFTTAMGATACGPRPGMTLGGCAKSTAAIVMPGADPFSVCRGGANDGSTCTKQADCAAPGACAVQTFVGGVGGMGSGSVSFVLPFIYSVTYVTNGTGPGTFFPGGGPPLRTYTRVFGATYPLVGTPSPGNPVFTTGPGPGAPDGYVAVIPGPNRFGGTMRLLGRPGHSLQFWWSPVFGGYLNTSLKFLFNVHGASYRGDLCPNPGPYSPPTYLYPYNACPSRTTNFFGRTDGDMNPQYDMMGDLVTDFSRLFKTATRWTTGVAVATGGGGFPTVIQRTGYDNRTVDGGGTIQLVTPQLTNWVFNTTTSTAGVTILKLQFLPEPDAFLLLGAGVLFLTLIGRRRAKR